MLILALGLLTFLRQSSTTRRLSPVSQIISRPGESINTVHSDGGGDKGNRHNDEENGQNVHSSILRFFYILLELASSWPESSLVGGLTFGL